MEARAPTAWGGIPIEQAKGEKSRQRRHQPNHKKATMLFLQGFYTDMLLGPAAPPPPLSRCLRHKPSEGGNCLRSLQALSSTPRLESRKDGDHQPLTWLRCTKTTNVQSTPLQTAFSAGETEAWRDMSPTQGDQLIFISLFLINKLSNCFQGT